MEIIKDYIRPSNIAAPIIQQIEIEYDCIIPDNMPDALQVSVVEEMAYLDGARVDNTFTVSEFTVNYNIIYVSDSEETPVKSFTSISKHSQTSDISSVNKDTLLKGTAYVDSVEYTLINNRKISIKSSIRIELNGTDNSQLGIASDVAGIDDIKTLTRNAEVFVCTENVATTCDISSNLELPGIKQPFEKILRSVPQLCDLNYTTTDDKMQIRGNLSICTLYICADNMRPIQIMENQIPFTHSLPIEPCDNKQCRLTDYSIKHYQTEIIEDSDGIRRILNVNATVVFNVKTYTGEELLVLEDAFSLQNDLSVVKEDYSVISSMEDVLSTFVVKDVIGKTEDTPAIKEIADINCNLSNIEVTCNDKEIVLNGEIICKVLYLTDDVTSPVSTFTSKLIFEQNIEQRNSTVDSVPVITPEINHISFGLISDSETELRISITIRGIIAEYCELSVVADIVENESGDENICDNTAPILLYIVQPGDSIWKISKKYRMDPELIKKVNRLPEPYIIYPGQKIIISK